MHYIKAVNTDNSVNLASVVNSIHSIQAEHANAAYKRSIQMQHANAARKHKKPSKFKAQANMHRDFVTTALEHHSHSDNDDDMKEAIQRHRRNRRTQLDLDTVE